MEAIQIQNKPFSWLMIVLLIVSCTTNIVFTAYQPIKNNTWGLHEKITFNFAVKDTISKQNVFINIRNNNDYKYSNLYVITELIFPNKTIVIDTLQYEMADLNGRYLGQGFSETKENKLFYKENKVFPIAGDYTFKIRHAMRKTGNSKGIEALEGITDVGFSIEKTN